MSAAVGKWEEVKRRNKLKGFSWEKGKWRGLSFQQGTGKVLIIKFEI